MYTIGIDLGGTGIKAGVVDEKGAITGRVLLPTVAERPGAQIAEDVLAAARLAMVSAGVVPEQVRGCGLAVPGVVCRDELLFINNIPSLDRYPLTARLAEGLEMPVKAGNDANCAAIGEWRWGVGVGCEDMVLITLGTGVGGGAILGGRLFAGRDGTAAEFGHMILHRGEPTRCNCGFEGCAEQYLSARSLCRRAMGASAVDPGSGFAKQLLETSGRDARVVFDFAAAGDKLAQRVLDLYIADLAGFIASLIALFRPQLLAIGGGLSGQGEGLLAPLRAELARLDGTGFLSIGGGTELAIAKNGNDAGILGAAALIEQQN